MSLQTGQRSAGCRPESHDAPLDPHLWVERHGDVLYRYALLRLRSPDQAADVVQDTFLEALRVQDSFAGRSSERTWLVGILKHKVIDRLRKASRGPVAVMGHEGGAARESPFDRRGLWRAGPAAWRGDPVAEIETREFWEVFGRCLENLPRGIADSFFLREVDGLDAEQVQEILAITPSNFWKRLHRARSLLRQCLESNWFGHSKRKPSAVKGVLRA